ncbi:hypothetical protein apy_16450 [Aeropyrum pernix]|uniref:Uncharacterized protein n=1 Tax=Aeropyrum pernix TaxID=56636 RepID=A0A401HC00_AERPX|nr:hypothetical protein [Aeropyrum pernix]GBF09920.1 hypothetical protein apy_16450 [Aeropyrum pernix]
MNSFNLSPAALAVIAVAALFAGGVSGYLYASFSIGGELVQAEERLSKANERVEELESSLSQFSYPRSVSLPEDWVREGPVIPMMGQHVVNYSNMPLGPILLLGNDGSLIGMEYMFTLDMLEEVTIMTPHGPESILELEGLPVTMPDLGVTPVVHHMNIEYLPHGHEGFDQPHFDIHIYFVDEETLADLTT